MSRNSTTIAAGIKLGIFTVVSILVTGLLAVIMGNFGFGDQSTYRAVFSTASMLQKGDDVRVAGVSVGEVKKVEHYDRTEALVTFRVSSDVPLTTASRAEIRYLNLVGDRYLALEEGADQDAAPLEDGGTIPIAQTKPALDLTVLFNGFQPLFQALTPQQVNDLSMNLVQVLQGEGGTVQGLLAKTASMQGFNALDMWGRFDEAFADLRRWESEGKLVHRETVFDGLESCVDALNGLFTGANVGKMLVKVSEPSSV